MERQLAAAQGDVAAASAAAERDRASLEKFQRHLEATNARLLELEKQVRHGHW